MMRWADIIHGDSTTRPTAIQKKKWNETKTCNIDDDETALTDKKGRSTLNATTLARDDDDM